MSQHSFSDEAIKKAIAKTGLPTEIKVTNLLRESKWSVFNEYPYLDSDNGGVRTIDLRAIKVNVISNQKNKNPFITVLELFIECKKSLNEAWVFHVADLKDVPESYETLASKRLFSITKQPAKGKTKEFTCLNHIPLTYSRNFIEHKIALSHQVIGGKDLLFEAYMQLIKNLIDEDRKATEEDNKIKGKNYPYSEFVVIPMIVFDGAMFQCYYKEGQLVTSKINFVRSIVNILPSQKLPALIDVVSLEILPQYIKNIESEFPKKKIQVETTIYKSLP
jgi:hypothetical protein